MDLTVRLMDWWSVIDQPLHQKNKTFRKSFFGWLNSCNMQMRLTVSLLRLPYCLSRREGWKKRYQTNKRFFNCLFFWQPAQLRMSQQLGVSREGQSSHNIFLKLLQIVKSRMNFRSSLDCQKQNKFQYMVGHCRYREMNLTVRLIDQWSTSQSMHLEKKWHSGSFI